MLFSELKSSKKPRRSLPPNFKRWKNSLNPPKPNALLLKRPKSDSSAKSKIFKSILNEPTLPLLLSTKNSETSIKSSLNTNRKKKNSRSNSNLPRKRPDPCPLNCSRPRTLTKKLLTALKPLNEKTRTFKKKSPILPINSAKVENPSTSSKKPNDPWNRNETSSRLLLKKQKVPSKSKKLKFSDSPSKCPRTNRTSNDDWPRKKKKLEGDFNDLEIQLGHANRQAADASKNVKVLQGQLKDNVAKFDEAERRAEDTCEQMAVIERRSNLLTGEIEELRNAVEQAERGRKLAETELNESNE